MTLSLNVDALATRVGEEFKSIRSEMASISAPQDTPTSSAPVTSEGPGMITAMKDWKVANVRNVYSGKVGQFSFNLTSPGNPQGAQEWVVAMTSAELSEKCPIALQPLVWCADTPDQLTGTGLWEKSSGKIRLHCNIGLAASQPLVVSCTFVMA